MGPALLVADDEPIVQTCLEWIGRGSGYRVVEAGADGLLIKPIDGLLTPRPLRVASAPPSALAGALGALAGAALAPELVSAVRERQEGLLVYRAAPSARSTA